jgi:exopolysaccharide biosynthesis polyprenyl glycosylphosphotransferase
MSAAEQTATHELSVAPTPRRRGARVRSVEPQTSLARRRLDAQLACDLTAMLAALGVALGSSIVAHARLAADPWPWAYGPLVLLALHGRGAAWSDEFLLDELRRVALASSLVAVALTGAQTLLGGSIDARYVWLLWGLTLLSLALARTALRLTRRTPRLSTLLLRPTLIVGAGEIGAELARQLRREPRHGLLPIGFVDVGPMADAAALPLLGPPDQLVRLAAETDARCVAFAFPGVSDRALAPLVQRCQDARLEVFIVPRLFDALTSRQRTRHIGALPLSALGVADPRGRRFAAKYLLDRLIAAAMIVLLAPCLLLITALIRLTSPGPALFRQRRVGRDGQEFDLFKFRTMRGGAADDACLAPGLGRGPGGIEGDDRRTPIGAWLRRSSLDELPQLFNVLRGDMSLVGPRPPLPYEVEHYTPRDLLRLAVKPGITGLWQIRGRDVVDFRTMVDLDVEYIRRQSLGLDLLILLATIPSVAWAYVKH